MSLILILLIINLYPIIILFNANSCVLKHRKIGKYIL